MKPEKVVLKGWDQVEEELGFLGESEAELKGVEAEMEAQIAQVKGNYAVRLNELAQRIATSRMVIEQYTRKNMSDVRDDGDQKIELSTGVISTRKVDDIDYPDAEELLEALKQWKLEQYIDVKEKPMKSAIKAAAKKDETLFTRLGITTHKVISVTIKPNLTY